MITDTSDACDLTAVPIVDLVAEIITRDGTTFANGPTVDVIIIPRRFA